MQAHRLRSMLDLALRLISLFEFEIKSNPKPHANLAPP